MSGYDYSQEVANEMLEEAEKLIAALEGSVMMLENDNRKLVARNVTLVTALEKVRESLADIYKAIHWPLSKCAAIPIIDKVLKK